MPMLFLSGSTVSFFPYVGIHELVLLLQGLVGLVIGARIVMCLIQMSSDTDGDDKPMLKRRIKNALVFLIIAETAVSTVELLRIYFS